MKPFMHSVLAKTIAGVLAALLLAMLTLLRTPLVRALRAGWFATRAALQWMIAPWPVPRILVLAFVLIVFGIAARRMRALSTSAPHASLSKRDYREDEFLGVVWRWHYDSEGQPFGICAFCPRCDLQLLPRPGPFHVSTELHCSRCQRDQLSYDQVWEALEGRIICEIQRALRSGEWQAKIERQRHERVT